jgi:hypothetical protein
MSSSSIETLREATNITASQHDSLNVEHTSGMLPHLQQVAQMLQAMQDYVITGGELDQHALGMMLDGLMFAARPIANTLVYIQGAEKVSSRVSNILHLED